MIDDKLRERLKPIRLLLMDVDGTLSDGQLYYNSKWVESKAFDVKDGFGIYMLGSSPYSGYEIRNIDTSTVVDSHTITPGISCTGGATFKFGPFGDLLAGSDTSVTLSAEGKTFTITIIAPTGMVKCVES